MLEPRRLYRSDGKCKDGVTMTSWGLGKQPVWDVTVVVAFAPSRLNEGSLNNRGTTATMAEERTNEVLGISRQQIHFSTGGHESKRFFRREQLNFCHASL